MLAPTAPFAETVQGWRTSFQTDQQSIVVDFRALVNGVVPERGSHLLHSYPAKLLPQIPYFFVHAHCSLNTDARPLVLADPFCGSGTVLVEGVLHGCNVIGADSNPLARLVSTVKTRPLNRAQIVRQLGRINQRVKKLEKVSPPAVVNIKHWYRPSVIAELSKLAEAIGAIRTKDMREFMQVCLSVCVRRMSLADPRLSVPVRINPTRKKKYGSHYRQLNRHLKSVTALNVMSSFNQIVRKNASRIADTSFPKRRKILIHDDALTLDQVVAPDSVDLIVTSPPYIGAQKYIRSSSLSLGWLELSSRTLRSLEKQTIGREHFSKSEFKDILSTGIESADAQLVAIRRDNPLRAHIAAQYLVEMKRALACMHNILRVGGNLVLVIGPNTICGQQFDTPLYIERIAHGLGFKTEYRLIDHIRSRGLMTKRNKTAAMISSEWVLSLRK